VVRVEVLPNRQLLLIGEGEGSSTVHLWHEEGHESELRIRVLKSDPEARVRLEKMVHMDVRIVEFRKSALRTLGIDWQKSIDGPVFATAGDAVSSTLFRGSSANPIFSNLPNRVEPFQTYFGIATEITSRINYLASTGDAFMLAEPKLSCRSGGSARFLAGGELPIPVRGSNGEVTVEFKEFGIILNVEPVADPDNVIAAKIETEVSSVDNSINVLDVPGFLTRRTETEMNVREGETIVISGLVSKDSSEDANKVPGLSNLPVLGKLFESRDFRRARSELVIFVTPRVFDPAAAMNRDAIQSTDKRVQERTKVIDGSLKFGIKD
jgi:pilus assembly protein CpaC